MESVFERLCTPEVLIEAARRVIAKGGAPGVDGVTVEAFGQRLESAGQDLATELREGHYRPAPVRLVSLPQEGKNRPIAILTVRDRVVHRAVAELLGPLFEPSFSPASFAFRPGRGALLAAKAVETRIQEGCTFAALGDIERFFERILHPALLLKLKEKIPEPQLLSLVIRLVRSPVLRKSSPYPV